MKKMKWTKGMLGLAAMAVVFYMSALSCLAAEGKVTADTAKIRAQASTDSEVVGSTVKDKAIDILEAVKDSSGTVWYKVPVTNGGYGYIRSDLVQTSETVTPAASTATATQAPAASDAPKPEATVPTSIGEQQATIKSESNVRIRSGASTQHDTVASLPNGTSITLIGEANDSAGNKWYQLTCTYNNKSVEGYVRSDLITIGAAATTEIPAASEGENTEVPEGTEGTEGDLQAEGETPEEGTAEGEQPAEEAPEEEPVEENNDYEVVYTQNDAGEYEYYLYDNINGTRQKLADLLNVVNVANETSQKLQEQVDTDKIIIIILAVVIVILFVVITVLIFKMRDLYYEDYDEDEEEEEEPAPVRKKVRRHEEDDMEEPAPVKKKRPVAPTEQPREAQPKQAHPKPKVRENQELHAASKKEQPAKPSNRKSQNFLVDEDEFEFEFLNMDDKDL